MRWSSLLWIAAVAVAAGCDSDEETPAPATPAPDAGAVRPALPKRHRLGEEKEAPAAVPADPVRKDLSGQTTLTVPEGAPAAGVDFRRDGAHTSAEAKDLRFSGGLFEARAIADVGEASSLDEAPAEARAARPRRVVPALPGHVYLVRTHDPDRVMALRVTSLVGGSAVTFDWSESSAAHVAAAHFRGDAAILELGTVVMQARTGAQGGNASRVTLEEPAKWRRIKPSEHEIDVVKTVSTKDEATAYVAGGPIPADEAFVVESIDVYAAAPGDSNGHGEVMLRVARDEVLHLRDVGAAGLQWFAGRAVVYGGHEIVLELANSSAADVRLHGHFIPVMDARGRSPIAFAPARAPSDVDRAAGGPAGVRPFFLQEPRVTLQLRAGAGGGNPNSITMTGVKSMYVKRTATAPLQMDAPISTDEESAAYCEGGLVPRGKLFVVTRVDWFGSAKGDSNGHGALIVALMGTKLVNEHDAAAPIEGSWTGRIEVPPGGERTVYAEVANSSAVDVRIAGEFIDAPKDR